MSTLKLYKFCFNQNGYRLHIIFILNPFINCYCYVQDQVNKEELLNTLYLEFVNRVNEVGVDVNRCVVEPHTAPLIQFVCGLGPRKGSHLLKVIIIITLIHIFRGKVMF